MIFTDTQDILNITNSMLFKWFSELSTRVSFIKYTEGTNRFYLNDMLEIFATIDGDDLLLQTTCGFIENKQKFNMCSPSFDINCKKFISDTQNIVSNKRKFRNMIFDELIKFVKLGKHKCVKRVRDGVYIIKIINRKMYVQLAFDTKNFWASVYESGKRTYNCGFYCDQRHDMISWLKKHIKFIGG